MSVRHIYVEKELVML